MVRFDVQLLSVQLIFITDKRINFGNPGMCYRNLIDSVTPSNGGHMLKKRQERKKHRDEMRREIVQILTDR
jgi:hypothetical protein